MTVRSTHGHFVTCGFVMSGQETPHPKEVHFLKSNKHNYQCWTKDINERDGVQ